MVNASGNRESVLTKRAERFLASLQRYPFVPTSKVQTSLQEQGLPDCECWLSFHERYAGYESNLGQDGMVWGVMHQQYRYHVDASAEPAIVADKDSETGQWLVRCADMSPHYTIELNEHGHLEFDFTLYSSFDMFIERSAHSVDFRNKGQTTEYIDTSNPQALDMIIAAERNDALSDQFLELYETDSIMGTRVPGADEWESIVAIKPGVAGPVQRVYKAYSPPPKVFQPTFMEQVAQLFGKR